MLRLSTDKAFSVLVCALSAAPSGVCDSVFLLVINHDVLLDVCDSVSTSTFDQSRCFTFTFHRD